MCVKYSKTDEAIAVKVSWPICLNPLLNRKEVSLN